MTIRLAFDSTSLAADPARRTITALVVPWGKIGRHTNGDRWRFERKGSGSCEAAYAVAGVVHLARTLPKPLGKPRLIGPKTG